MGMNSNWVLTASGGTSVTPVLPLYSYGLVPPVPAYPPISGAAPEKGEEYHMRSLYQVYIYEDANEAGGDEVYVHDDTYAGCSEEAARLKAVVAANLKKPVDQYYFCVQKIGELRRIR